MLCNILRLKEKLVTMRVYRSAMIWLFLVYMVINPVPAKVYGFPMNTDGQDSRRISNLALAKLWDIDLLHGFSSYIKFRVSKLFVNG